jgi:hypothetical protein
MAESRKFHLKHSGFRPIDNSADTTKTLTDELHDDHATLVTWSAEVDADLDTMGDALERLQGRDGVLFSTASFATATAVTLAGTGMVVYQIDGRVYSAAVDTTITISDDGDVTQSKFRAWRILMGKDGLTTTLSSTMNCDNANLALLTLSKTAITAGTVEIGYFTATDSDSVINIGTDNTDAAGTTYVFYKVTAPRLQIGLTAANGAATDAQDGTATLDIGTVDAHICAGTLAGPWSRNLTQIGASANTALTVADTIDTLKYGGWLVCTDLAGTGYLTISADGDADATGVTAQAYATDAAVVTALDLVIARLPLLFCPVATVIVSNQSGGAFTAKTTNWDATSITTVATDFSAGAFDRTVTGAAVAGSTGVQAGLPTIPASVTAPLIATLTAGKSDTND